MRRREEIVPEFGRLNLCVFRVWKFHPFSRHLWPRAPALMTDRSISKRQLCRLLFPTFANIFRRPVSFPESSTWHTGCRTAAPRRRPRGALCPGGGKRPACAGGAGCAGPRGPVLLRRGRRLRALSCPLLPGPALAEGAAIELAAPRFSVSLSHGEDYTTAPAGPPTARSAGSAAAGSAPWRARAAAPAARGRGGRRPRTSSGTC
jgi:hypothetical protein